MAVLVMVIPRWKQILIDGAQGLPLEIGVPFFEASTPEYDNWMVVKYEADRRDTHRDRTCESCGATGRAWWNSHYGKGCGFVGRYGEKSYGAVIDFGRGPFGAHRIEDTYRGDEILAMDYCTGDVGPHPWGNQRESLCIDLGQWRGFGHGLAVMAEVKGGALHCAFFETHTGLQVRHFERETTDEDRETIAVLLVGVRTAMKVGAAA